MRLQKIHIRGYRVLDKFSLTFNDSTESQYTLNLLVGVNGTGKSTLLRALSEIFQNLYRGNRPRFGFYLHYQLEAGGEDIIVSNLIQGPSADIAIHYLAIEEHNQTNQRGLIRLWVNGDEVTANEGQPIQKIEANYLPRWVIVSTTGSEKDWELPLWEESEDDQRDHLPRNLDQLRSWYLAEQVGTPILEKRASLSQAEEQQFLFITADLIPLVVLCGFLQDMAQYNKAQLLDAAVREPRPDFIKRALKECKLAGLRGFSLKFRMNREILDPSDQEFIGQLAQKAHHSIQRGSDYLLVFSLARSLEPQTEQISGTVRPEDFFSSSITSIRFFQKLAQLQRSDTGKPAILREVHLLFAGKRQLQEDTPAQPDRTRRPQSPLLLFDWLSDGEQSFLGRICLFALFEADAKASNVKVNPLTIRNNEALILLDEPEVHFNDYWKRQLVRMLTRALQGTPRHVLMTTHSSITLSDVTNANIWILQRELDYTRYAVLPNIKTLGADPSDILVQVFGAENAVGAYSVDYILQTIKDARRQRRYDKPASLAKLQELCKELGPGYWRYLVRSEIEALGSEERAT